MNNTWWNRFININWLLLEAGPEALWRWRRGYDPAGTCMSLGVPGGGISMMILLCTDEWREGKLPGVVTRMHAHF